MKTLKERLHDWTDVDVAQYELGQVLGLIPESQSFQESKWIFWTANPLGNQLYETLMALSSTRIFETSLEKDAFRFRK